MLVKRDLDSLALFGGLPEFDSPLHVGSPNVGDRQRLMQRIEAMLDRNWLTNDGPYVEELEQRIADFVGVRHCVAMCNGTIALEIAARALGLSGEVIVPSFTFVATAHALQWQEIKPVFCDIERESCTIDVEHVERLITPRTTGIIGVHLWGRPCNVERLAEIADEHGLRLAYDAAHAFGCENDGKKIGCFGDAEVFSFHATKFFNTFEGGAVVTDDDALAEKMRLMKNFGFSGYDNVIHLGTNGKMTEVAAAMGLTNLESLDAFVAVNKRNYQAYREGLSDIPGVSVIEHRESDRTNYQYVILDLDETTIGISRDHVARALHAENVRARRYFFPGCHKMEPYRSQNPHSGLLLPETERMAGRVLALPNGTAVGEDDIGKICALIRLITENGRALSERAPQRIEPTASN